ncbi:MAG: esterase-like activity of phytase family protein [Planctomycetota bacterium]
MKYAAVVLCMLAGSSLADPGDIEFRLIGERHLEPRAEFLGTRIGGISGIDFEPRFRDSGTLVILSDDPGRYAPARAYLGQIELAEDRIVGLDWSYLLRLTWASGDLITGTGLDPEGIRFMMHEGVFGEPSLMWVSEGTAVMDGRGDPGAPRIYEMCSAATRMDEWPAPATHVASEPGVGVKTNRSWESIAMVGYELAVVATEEPLKQDGESDDGTGWVRLSTYSFAKANTEPIAQVVYPLGPTPDDVAFGNTGLTDLLGLADGRLLSVERTFTPTGTFRVDLFVVDPSEATDVLSVDSLKDADFTPATKTHVATLNDLAPTVLNVEGVCFGPTLDDGIRTLVFVSDSDFRPGIPTVFTALAIEEDGGVLVPADTLPPSTDEARAE